MVGRAYRQVNAGSAVVRMVPEDYWREADAPAASSRSTLRNPAAACSSESASSGTVAAMWGDSERKRTLIRLCPRAVIKVLTTGESSWVQRLRVVRTTGPGRDTDHSRG